MITKIVFPVPNQNLGDTSAADADSYREWFSGQLRSEYPDAEIVVTNQSGRIHVETDDDGDDIEIRDKLQEFGNRCWDHCPWDWKARSK